MEEGTELDEADRWYGTQLRILVPRKGDTAICFREKERKLRIDDRCEYRSGRALSERIMNFRSLRTTTMAAAAADEIQARVIMQPGDGVMTIEAACMHLVNDREALPVDEKNAIDVYKLLLSKIPSSVNEDGNRTN